MAIGFGNGHNILIDLDTMQTRHGRWGSSLGSARRAKAGTGHAGYGRAAICAAPFRRHGCGTMKLSYRFRTKADRRNCCPTEFSKTAWNSSVVAGSVRLRPIHWMRNAIHMALRRHGIIRTIHCSSLRFDTRSQRLERLWRPNPRGLEAHRRSCGRFV